MCRFFRMTRAGTSVVLWHLRLTQNLRLAVGATSKTKTDKEKYDRADIKWLWLGGTVAQLPPQNAVLNGYLRLP